MDAYLTSPAVAVAQRVEIVPGWFVAVEDAPGPALRRRAVAVEHATSAVPGAVSAACVALGDNAGVCLGRPRPPTARRGGRG